MLMIALRFQDHPGRWLAPICGTVRVIGTKITVVENRGLKLARNFRFDRAVFLLR